MAHQNFNSHPCYLISRTQQLTPTALCVTQIFERLRLLLARQPSQRNFHQLLLFHRPQLIISPQKFLLTAAILLCAVRDAQCKNIESPDTLHARKPEKGETHSGIFLLLCLHCILTTGRQNLTELTPLLVKNRHVVNKGIK